ncbi:MFS transporter [Streptomyces kunmingensis]|uniref:MFS transporter n=1 Tax=Streptomyces kunmingensis TaxID=68225 RepID=A0ABU6C851_9ACTN|nr:MFS transporter [Streptomyces kunmingensis]MEB3960894.1 MFS transporter [Streptomyces kunmingensis]
MPEPRSPDASATTTPSRPRAGLVATYREVLAAPGATRLAVASLVSKWPISMFPVSTLLLVSPAYSYARAGAVVAAMLLANAASSPARGRQIARRGARVVLRICLAGYLAGLTGIAVAAASSAPFPVVLTAAALMGAFFPPASILLRSHWTAVDRGRGHSSANALESALMDLSLITGPILASWLSTYVTPVLPLALIGVLMTLAVALLSGLPDQRPPSSPPPGRSRRSRRSRRLLRTPLVGLFGAQFLFCAALAATEVSLPVYAQQQNAAAYSGWLLAGLSVGSIVGALVLGRLPGSGATRLPVLLVLLAAGMCAIGGAMFLGPVAVAAASVPAGLAIGSVFARFFTVLGAATPPGVDHEVQGWANSMTTVGFAAGSFGGAALADALGTPALLLCSPLAAVVAACLAAWSASAKA